jgi:hypothetical protein
MIFFMNYDIKTSLISSDFILEIHFDCGSLCQS